MAAHILRNFSGRLLVVGPLYDQIGKLETIQKLTDQYDQVILNGNITYPSHDLDQVQERINKLQELPSTKVIYNLGSLDLQLLKHLADTNQSPDILKWLKSKGNVVMVEFISQSRLIVTGGGLTPKMNIQDLHNSIETSFVSHINNVPWHQSYGGAFGYVISNNPLTQSSPQFYDFSAQIGNQYQKETPVYALQVESHGVGKAILL